MNLIAWSLMISYLAVLGLLSLYGLHRLWLLWLWWSRYRRRPPEPAPKWPSEREWPSVTVQIPLYNEPVVAARAIRAAAAMDYPKERLEIQILDDSTDETTEIAGREVEKLRSLGFRATLLHRDHRSGFKAGALQNGLRQAAGEFFAIFDADFVPPRDFLRRTIPYFLDPKIGMVQARWGHLNPNASLLTRLQAAWLDGHFVIEHTARNRSGAFFNFNGTAGVWRRRAIEEAGGWQGDTLAEDLDLSYRAQLRGWRFHFLPDLEAPAELPLEVSSFQTQQYRWARGSAQVARKLLGKIWRSPCPPLAKLEATAHLAANFAFPLLLCLTLLMPLSIWARVHLGWPWILHPELVVLATTICSVSAFYIVAFRHLDASGWRRRTAVLPAVMTAGIGMAVNNSRAVLAGLFGKTGEFLRTPKRGVDPISPVIPRAPSVILSAAKNLAVSFFSFRRLPAELWLAAYAALAAILAGRHGAWAALPNFLLFIAGYAYIGWLRLAESSR